MSASRRGSLKAALLGLSHPHSAPHLATLQNLPEVGEIVAWDGQYEAKRHGALLANRKKLTLCTDDLAAVLRRGDIDFAIVCVPTDDAAALTCRVLKAGIHVMAEKPVGLNPGEIRRVMAAARKAKVQASVLYCNRWLPAIREARRLVRGGAIGPLLTAEARMLTTQVRFREPRSWLFSQRRAGGGILTWLGCHFFDVLQYVSGEPIVAVSAQLGTRSGEKIDVEDVAAVAFRLRSGAVGTLQAGYVLAFSGGGYLNGAGNDMSVGFTGRRGRVTWAARPLLRIESPVKRGSPVRERTFPAGTSTSYGGKWGEGFLRQFIASFQKGAEPPAGLEAALRTALILEAVHKSAETGREVAVRLK